MDIMTILGWVFGFGLIAFGMFFDEATTKFMFQRFGDFVNLPSLAITVGGTISALMVAFPMKAFANVPKHLKICIIPPKYDPYTCIEQISEFAREARMKGLLSLEDKLNETNDEFLKSSLMLVVDSVDPEKVHELLELELDHLDERHAQDRGFYDKGGAFAPGFGMIGTLVGLVNMLQQMEDPDSIGPAMGVALLTTLYGSMLSNLFFSPLSNKLKVRHEEEFLCKTIICRGVEAIQAGENPKFIEEKLTMLVKKSKKKGKETAEATEE